MKKLIILTILLLIARSGQLLTYPLLHLQSPVKRHSIYPQPSPPLVNHNLNLNKYLHNQQPPTQSNPQLYSLISSGFTFFILLKVTGINYYLQVDTGSSDFFIKGQNSTGNPKYRYVCGDACLNNNVKYTLNYLDGKVQVYQAKLLVELGSHRFNQSLLVSYKNDANFDQLNGILGLSFATLAKNTNPTFLQTLIDNQIISHYSFGVNLNFQNKSRSFITFGSYDTQFFKGSLTFIPLASKTDYVVDIDGIITGASGLMKIAKGIFDTGNTCISIPKALQQNILNNFNSVNNKCAFQQLSNNPKFSQFFCKVGNFNQLPNLIIVIGGHYYNIQKQAFLRKCVRNKQQQIIDDNPNAGNWYCQTYIESADSTTLFLGDGFFNRFYTYFDLQNYRIGVAKHSQNLTMSLILSTDEFDQNIWSSLQQQEQLSFFQKIIRFFKQLF